MTNRRLAIGLLLQALARHHVEYVITGSVAAKAYGVALAPGDLDIAPSLGSDNLGRLAGLLRDLGARPKHLPDWPAGLSLEECRRWVPEPATEQHLDHRFETPHGELDVVPRKAGEYDVLVRRSVPMTAFGVRILVAHPDDLVALCERWNREKDRQRLAGLRVAQQEYDRNPAPGDVGARLERT